MHNAAHVSDSALKDFLQSIFDMDIKIIGHNLKYDLEVLYTFLSQNFPTSSSS